MQELPELVRWATAIVRMLAPHAANHQALREAVPTLLVLLHRDDSTVSENAAASLTFVMRRYDPCAAASPAPPRNSNSNRERRVSASDARSGRRWHAPARRSATWCGRPGG